MKVTILGANGAFGKASTAYLIENNGEHILVDLSLETLKYMLAEMPDVVEKINHVFFTHMHQDHVCGVESFLLYRLDKLPSADGKHHDKIPGLHFFGPEGFLRYYESLVVSKNRNPENHDHIKGLISAPYLQPFKFKEIPTKSGIYITAIGKTDINVEAFPVTHNNGIIPAFGFEFTNHKGKSIIISGDTDGPVTSLFSDIANDPNIVLFHDAGWTGVDPESHFEKLKCHPREDEIHAHFGDADNIYMVHLGDDVPLEHYKRAYQGMVIEL